MIRLSLPFTPSGFASEWKEISSKAAFKVSFCQKDAQFSVKECKIYPYGPQKAKESKVVADKEQVKFKFDDYYQEEEPVSLLKSDPLHWKEQDHYAILGIGTLRWRATDEDIKKAYRRKALKHHPDKKGHKKESDAYFKCVQKAYDVLGDPEKRRQWDSCDPKFYDSYPKEVKHDFFQEFQPVFERNAHFSVKKPIPELGGKDATRAQVEAFYNFWATFQSWRSFEMMDEDPVDQSENRDERRWLEKQNKAQRAKLKKEENARIQKLVETAMKLDPRVQQFKEDDKKEKEMKKQKKEEAQLKAKEEQRLKEEEKKLEEQRAEEQKRREKEERDKRKQKLKDARRNVRIELKRFVSEDKANSQLESIISALGDKVEEVLTLTEQLKSMSDMKQAGAFLEQIYKAKCCSKEEFAPPVEAKAEPPKSEPVQEAKKDIPWSDEEIKALIKAVNAFPGGTLDRWTKVADYVSQHSGMPPRMHNELIKKSKEVKSTGFIANASKLQKFQKKDAPVITEEPTTVAKEVTAAAAEAEPKPWTPEEQGQLEKALKAYPASYKESDRWDKIAAMVEGRTKKEVVANWMHTVDIDPYNSTQYNVWDLLVDFATSRVNSINGMTYSEDTTIMMYSILGEVIPSPREAQFAIAALLRRVADRLKLKAPRTLVGSGGLLHMSQYSGYNDPRLYWQDIYGYGRVDVCMIHVYQVPSKSLPRSSGIPDSEWTQLGTYSSFCAARNKTLIIDEMGLNLDVNSRNNGVQYFKFIFDSAYATVPDIPIVQLWNWRPGETFDLFTGDDFLITQIIRQNSRRWGFEGSFGFVQGQSAPVEVILVDGEATADLSGVSGSFSVTRSQVVTTRGAFSLRMWFNFPSTAFATNQIIFNRQSGSTWRSDWSAYSSGGRLSCDVLVRSSAPVIAQGLNIRFSVTGSSGQMYIQSPEAIATNFIIANQWTRVYMKLDRNNLVTELSRPTYNALLQLKADWSVELADIRRFEVAIVHDPGLRATSGEIFLDYCRLDTLQQLGDEESINQDQLVPCKVPATQLATQTTVITRSVAVSSPRSVQVQNQLVIDQRSQQSGSNGTTSTTNYLFDITKALLQDTEEQSKLFELGIFAGVLGTFLFVISALLYLKRRYVARMTSLEANSSDSVVAKSNDQLLSQ